MRGAKPEIPKPGVTSRDVPEYQSRSIIFGEIFHAGAVRISSGHKTVQDPSRLHTTTVDYGMILYGNQQVS